MPRPVDLIRVPSRLLALSGLALALVGTPSSAQDKAPAAKDARPGPAFDLSLVPADAPAVFAFRPAALLKLPDVRSLYDEAARPEEVKRVLDVAEPETVEQITFVLLRRDLAIGGDPGEALAQAGAILVKTNKPREWKALAAAGGISLIKATHAGKDYYKTVADAAPGFGFYQPDDTTLVVASESSLRRLIDGAPAEPAKTSRVRTVPDFGSGTPLAAVSVDFAWFRDLVGPRIKSDHETALFLSLIGPIWEKTNDVVVGLAATEADGVTLTADHVCSDEAGAKRVAQTLDAFLTLGRNVAPDALRLVREQSQGSPITSDLASLGEQALKSVTVEQKGLHVRLTLSAKADVAKMARDILKGK